MSTRRQYRPIAGIVSFNLFTVLVFVTAPVQWRTDNVALLCLYVLLCQAVIFAAFRAGHDAGWSRPATEALPLFRGDRFVRFLLLFYVITLPVTYGYRFELSPLDLSGMLDRFQTGLRDPHYGYTSMLSKSGGPVSWTVFFATAIFNQVFFAAGLVYWRRFSVRAKALFVTLIALDLLYWISIAMSFGVVSHVTTFALSAMFWQSRAGSRRRLAVLAVLFALTVAFFSYNLYRRSNYSQVEVANYQLSRSPMILDHPAFSVVPRPLWPTYVMVVTYLAQGYYHTCFAFDLEFRTTGMLGNNTALISFARMFGLDVWPDTYMHRLGVQGIDEFGQWHSAYTWFASDVSYYGVPVLLAFLAFLFGVSWVHGLQGDLLSRIVFIMFGNVLLFLFANNTYLASVFYAFMVFVPLWAATRVLGLAGRRQELSPSHS